MRKVTNESVDLHKIRWTIKKLLRKYGLSYKDLALKLAVSESTVKYFMANSDLPLSRIEKIAAQFGLSLLEFFEVAKNNEDVFFQLTDEQED